MKFLGPIFTTILNWIYWHKMEFDPVCMWLEKDPYCKTRSHSLPSKHFQSPPSNLKTWQGICKFVSIFCRFYKYSTFRNSSFLWNNQLNWNAIKGFWPEWGFFKLQLTNRIENLSMPVMIKMEMGKSDECHSRQPKTWVMPTFVRKKRLKTF